jgi:hypothetical protein
MQSGAASPERQVASAARRLHNGEELAAPTHIARTSLRLNGFLFVDRAPTTVISSIRAKIPPRKASQALIATITDYYQIKPLLLHLNALDSIVFLE